MADKTALERIGLAMFAATLFVIGAAGFAVHHQLAGDTQTANAVQVAQLPGQNASLTSGILPVVLK